MQVALSLLAVAVLASTVPSPTAQEARARDFIVPAGQIVQYDTNASGPLFVRHLVLEPGSTLRVRGSRPFVVLAFRSVSLQGTIDLSGFDARSVATLNTGQWPEQGAAGVAGGGQGGVGSSVTDNSTPKGGPGSAQHRGGGGGGGESGYSPLGTEERRPGGGGGGALAANHPSDPSNPAAPANRGLVATPGGNGAATARGACSGTPPPAGGAAGQPAFTDDDPDNDFWGVKFDRQARWLIRGELARPVPGAGGGAGGDALPSAVFPTPNWNPASDEKGAGGGGGGGLGVILSPLIQIGAGGGIRAQGGKGAVGENTFFLDHIGGSSAGGSGGYLVLEAMTIDLVEAMPKSITALGGKGGDFPAVPGNVGLGGHGGPGVIQMHVPIMRGSILLPPGSALDELTSPPAHVLVPRFPPLDLFRPVERDSRHARASDG